MQGIHRQIHTSPFFYNISRVPWEVLTPIAHHNVCPLRDQNSIDEAMIAFKGHKGYKQYRMAKSTCFGIKVWECADEHNGYVCEFQVYTGEKVLPDGTRIAEIKLRGRVARDLTCQLITKCYHIYMDKYFTRITWFDQLLDGYYVCGTILVLASSAASKTLENSK